MKRTKIISDGYTITETEAHIIRHCIDYCWHRIKKHKKSGISNVVNSDTIEELLDIFNRRLK